MHARTASRGVAVASYRPLSLEVIGRCGAIDPTQGNVPGRAAVEWLRSRTRVSSHWS